MVQELKVILCAGEDGFIAAECPALPGCVSQGRAKAEALANIREAIELHLEAMQLVGETPPAPSTEVELVEIAG